jgi:hypothetical protein
MSDEPRYVLMITRYGALGIVEVTEELRDATQATVEQIIARQFETMTPLDRCAMELVRIDRP